MFLFVVQVSGAWTIATRDGHLLVCSEADLPPGAPRLVANPHGTVPTMPLWTSECAHCRPRPAHEDDEQLEAAASH